MYDKLAYVYDSLIDFDYDQLTEIVKENIKPDSTILDLACGTGTIMKLLANEGYNMIGSDISEDMLELARGKNPNSKLFLHDLKEDFSVEADSFTCFLDSINYLLRVEDVDNLFKNVSRNITNGKFIFDVHSKSKLNTMTDYLNVDLDYDVSYIWSANVVEDYIKHYLTFFLNDKGLYERFDEEHTQRVYSEDTISELLTKHGFKFNCKYLEDRIVYICNK